MGEEHDSWFKKALGVDVAKTVRKIESAGSAVTNAQAAAWDGTKKAYGAVTGAYDAVAPNFTEANKNLGDLVDAGEASAKKGNKMAAAKYQGVPIVGTALKGAARVSDVTTEVAGGVVKGVGDIAATGGNSFVHPIDSAKSLGEGALGIAEHVPIAPGLNTTVKGVHGVVDLARGKKDGEYGGSVKDLGKNLLLDTKQDPKNPGKRTNADVDFLAGMGGGTKAWTDKPVEAATRTIVNIAPMVLGDEGPTGTKPIPKVELPLPPGEVPIPKGGPGPQRVVIDPQTGPVDPMGKTQPGIPAKGPVTEVDPAKPGPAPDDAPQAKPAQTPEQIRQNLADAAAAQKVAEKTSVDATAEYARYRATKPNAARGVVGDGKWDPVVDEALKDQMDRAQKASSEANDKWEAAQKASTDAEGFVKDKNGKIRKR
jgi:hypothetical protein